MVSTLFTPPTLTGSCYRRVNEALPLEEPKDFSRLRRLNLSGCPTFGSRHLRPAREVPPLSSNLTNPRRLQALAETCLVHSPPEDAFDRYTRLCSALLDVPAALVVLVGADRVFLKSRCAPGQTAPLEPSGPTTQSFCQYVVIEQQAFVVADCQRDERTKGSVAVTDYHIRAYAGLPLRTPEGEVLGSFCAIDYQPRAWSERELSLLADLRNGIESEIALRLQVIRLDHTSAELRRHLRAVQQLFSNLDHEVRTPLNALLNLSQACLEPESQDSARELAHSVHRSAAQLVQLLEGALDMAALEAGRVALERQATEIRPLLALSQTMFASLNRPGLELSSQVDAELPEWLAVDGRRLSQLIALLWQWHLGQAGWQGRCRQEALWLEPDRLEVLLSCDGYRLPAEQAAKLFRSDGIEGGVSGLSPALIGSLQELLEAKLQVESSSDGVRFTLRLPVGPAVRPAPERQGVGAPLRLLAIDDDPTNLKVLDFLLAKLGHRLTGASSGSEGLEYLETEPFDVVLLDLRMPELDGFEVAREVRRRGWQVPIVAVTADVSEEAKREAMACGMNAFLTKPVRRAELLEVLARHAP